MKNTLRRLLLIVGLALPLQAHANIVLPVGGGDTPLFQCNPEGTGFTNRFFPYGQDPPPGYVGFPAPVACPEPTSAAILVMCLLGLLCLPRRRP